MDGLASGGLVPGEVAARLAAFLGVSLAAALAKFALDDWLPLNANLRTEVEASDEAVDQLLAMPQRAFERHDAGLRGSRTVVAVMHSGELDAAADRIYEVRDGLLTRAK